MKASKVTIQQEGKENKEFENAYVREDASGDISYLVVSSDEEGKFELDRFPMLMGFKYTFEINNPSTI